jgi:hypothetical protein
VPGVYASVCEEVVAPLPQSNVYGAIPPPATASHVMEELPGVPVQETDKGESAYAIVLPRPKKLMSSVSAVALKRIFIKK